MKKLKAVLCAIFGHSRIQTSFFGYWYCGRCGTTLGDSLGAVYNAKDVVLVGHDCESCRENWATLEFFKDKLMAPSKDEIFCK